MNTINVEHVANGYIVQGGDTTYVFYDLEQVCDYLLNTFEGLSDVFTGELFGRVVIERGQTARIDATEDGAA